MGDAALVEDALAADLRGRSADRFELAVGRAVELGAAGEALLVDALGSTAGWRRVAVAARLGDATGPRGPAALRDLLGVTGPGTRDLRCVALLALAKRLGADATQDLADALVISDPGVHDYAGVALAKVGDDRAWESVLAGLSTLLQRRGRRSAWPPRASWEIGYLARHADSERLTRLVSTLRASWAGLTEAEREWLEVQWPEVAPGGTSAGEVPAPDVGRLPAMYDALFEPLT
jgi:hypothetical protein